MLLKLVYNGKMKFGLRNTSFVYPNGSGDIWKEAVQLILELWAAEATSTYFDW
jgi:hypothetical protein